MIRDRRGRGSGQDTPDFSRASERIERSMESLADRVESGFDRIMKRLDRLDIESENGIEDRDNLRRDVAGLRVDIEALRKDLDAQPAKSEADTAEQIRLSHIVRPAVLAPFLGFLGVAFAIALTYGPTLLSMVGALLRMTFHLSNGVE